MPQFIYKKRRGGEDKQNWKHMRLAKLHWETKIGFNVVSS